MHMENSSVKAPISGLHHAVRRRSSPRHAVPCRSMPSILMLRNRPSITLKYGRYLFFNCLCFHSEKAIKLYCLQNNSREKKANVAGYL